MWNRIFRQKCSSVDSYRCKTSLLIVTQQNAPRVLRNAFTCSHLSGNDSEETTTLLHTGFLKKKTIIFSWSRSLLPWLIPRFIWYVHRSSPVHSILSYHCHILCLRFVLKLPYCHNKQSILYRNWIPNLQLGFSVRCGHLVYAHSEALILLVCEVRVRRYCHYDYLYRSRFFRNTNFLNKNP